MTNPYESIYTLETSLIAFVNQVGMISLPSQFLARMNSGGSWENKKFIDREDKLQHYRNLRRVMVVNAGKRSVQVLLGVLKGAFDGA
jgi:hypothetical protein